MDVKNKLVFRRVEAKSIPDSYNHPPDIATVILTDTRMEIETLVGKGYSYRWEDFELSMLRIKRIKSSYASGYIRRILFLKLVNNETIILNLTRMFPSFDKPGQLLREIKLRVKVQEKEELLSGNRGFWITAAIYLSIALTGLWLKYFMS